MRDTRIAVIEREDAPLSAADQLWWGLRREATAAVQLDELMAEPLTNAILRQSGFGTALGRRLARKLADDEMDATRLTMLFAEAVAHDPRIAEGAACDLSAVRDRDPACPDLLTPFLFFKGYHSLQVHRFAHYLWKHGRTHLARHLQSRCAEVFAVDIHPAARLGLGIMVDHGTGLVIGETAVVEDEVSMLQGVTLGGTGKQSGDRHPKVRRGVLIGAGAKVLGNIEVGEGAKVGAGSIVLHDVAPHTTVVGVPARAVGARLTSLPGLTMDQTLPPIDYVI